MPEKGDVNILKIHPGIYVFIDLFAGNVHYLTLEEKGQRKGEHNQNK